MSAAVRVKDLFAIECAFDRPAGEHRELGDDDLVRERVGLAAETATMCRADHPDPVHRELQYLC